MNDNTLLIALAVVAAVAVVFAVRRLNRPKEGAAQQLLDNGARLVDVRTPNEYAGGHIAGAVNIPVQDLARRVGELGAKTGPVLLYCRSGGRSGQAKRLLEADGFTQIMNLGAMNHWKDRLKTNAA